MFEYRKRITSFVLALTVFVAAFPLSTGLSVGAAENDGQKSETNNTSSNLFAYYNQYKDAERPTSEIKTDVSNISGCKNPSSAVKEYQGKTAVCISEDQSWCEWEFNVAEAGNYELYFDYLALPGNGKNIGFSVSIDGAVPFSDFESVSLPRIWKDSESDFTENGEFKKDETGNQIRPKQIEIQQWQETALYDSQGLYSEPYFVYFEKGHHTLKVNALQESVAIASITLKNSKALKSYEEYISNYSDAQTVSCNPITVQAEYTYTKNNSLLYPTYDRNDPFAMPSDARFTVLNTIGQSNWSTQGDEISWKIKVEQPGLYKLSFRVKQNYNKGMISHRVLKINGEIPFSEAADLGFEYRQSWYISTFGGDDPYYIYLQDGDVLSLTCTTGSVSEILRDVRASLLELNNIYREIISITSTEPDIYRDYSLNKQIPDLEERLINESDEINKISDAFFKLTGTRGSEASVLDYVSKTLKEFADKPYTIPERLSTLKSNIESIGSLILTLGSQPLELDYFLLTPKDVDVPEPKKGFFKSLKFYTVQFMSSFSDEYSTLADKESDKVNVDVWVTTGRDQFNIITDLINNEFNNDKVKVSLAMVDTGDTLIKATLAGKGPDAAIMMPMDTPMNLAARGALTEFTDDEISDIKSQFNSQAFTPFYYDGKLYAIPETMTFDMMFYRTDVFEEYGLEPPETWDDFYKIIEIFQKDNLSVGIPEINSDNMGVSLGISTFNKFLFQAGGKYFNDKQSRVMFNTQEAYDAFEKWVNLYSSYGLDREFSFYSRFRTGEMALSIQNYNAYNQLASAAPEIRGLWKMVPIPGTRKEDGTIDRSEDCTVTGCTMLKKAENRGIKNETMSFLKWWSSAETQVLYGQSLEAAMGIAARYTPANLEALNKMGWTYSELQSLKQQIDQIVGIPVVPGNYVISRSLTSAFRAAVDGKYRPKRAIAIYSDTINDEIKRKRTEFNLD